MSKTVVFGGAFDPPHNEHVNMCKAAVRELGADKLVIVPTYLPPHKCEGFLDFAQRAQLARLAFSESGVPTVIDGIEFERKKDNYSAEVLPLLKEKYGDIVYLIGGDSLEFFLTWHKPEEIVKCCPIAVAGREGYEDISLVAREILDKIGGKFILLEYTGKDVSSAVLRAKLLLGEDTDEIPECVGQYIKENKLFCDYAGYLEKLKSYQSEELFEHSRYVVLRAVDFNGKHHLRQNFRKVFLSALLHDNAKQRPSPDGLNVPSDSLGTPVLHQFLGAEKARRDFGVTDEEVLNAIRFHTTAKADMSTLEKLIYTADSVSDDRTYPPIPKLREIAVKNFDEGFKAVLEYTYKKVSQRGNGVYPLTEEAVKYYLPKICDKFGITAKTN